MKRALIPFCALLSALLACSLPQFNLFSKVIKHDPPTLQIDNQFFADKDCFNSSDCLPENLKKLDPPIGMLLEPSSMLGGLTPKMPIAIATTMAYEPIADFKYVYLNQCLRTQYIRYVVSDSDTLVLVDSIDGLAALFAPIDTPEEALSYAIAATGYSAIYDLHEFPRPKLYVDSVEETFVTATEEGYSVHLFDAYLCGCGPHIAKSVEVEVSRDGQIKTSEPINAFSDPKMDELCID
jgi:hypothetical protein